MEILKTNSDKNLIQWTGVPPVYGQCPGVKPDGTIGSLTQLNLNASRKEVLDYFNNSWTLTEVLFSGLVSEEAFYKRPYHKLRHPLIFYYAHPAVVYVNKLRVAGLLDKPIHPEFERLFEVGVDEMRWDDLHEGKENVWPKIAEVGAYRKKVYSFICNLIETHPQFETANLPITQESPMWALVMGFEHERIHLETSSVLIRELPIELLQKPKEWPDFFSIKENKQFPTNQMLEQSACEVSLGKPNDWPSFGWDNEYGSETHNCPPFYVSKYLVSNGEFKEFVKVGGYSSEKYWCHEGWAWRSFRNIKWPTFWVPEGPAGLHNYKLRTVFEVVDMQWNWPVCVNYYEAKAFCRWRTERDNSKTPYRLLTEVEHHAIRDANLTNPSLGVARDIALAGDYLKKGYNINLATGGASPVDALAPNDKGIHDTFGNVWQWCEDKFHPLRGSKPHPYYEDFSVPCYDGKHQMILGGSFISTGDEASIWARFHFRPHFFQHAGLRLARDTEASTPSSSISKSTYESEEMLNKYMLMHWGSEKDILGEVPRAKLPMPQVVHLPLKCAELITKHSTGFERALDLGCAVGRSSFELAKTFKDVLGIDYSHEFINCANQLKEHKQLEYWRKDSGAKGQKLIAHVDKDIDLNRVKFEQGDACALPERLNNFDAVLLANVLCRLPHPVVCLERMQGAHALVKPGGLLVMTTPFSWLEEYTPKAQWLNGIEEVKAILSDFDLIYQEELPFLIREHRRKFEYIITLASVWKRKG